MHFMHLHFVTWKRERERESAKYFVFLFFFNRFESQHEHRVQPLQNSLHGDVVLLETKRLKYPGLYLLLVVLIF